MKQLLSIRKIYGGLLLAAVTLASCEKHYVDVLIPPPDGYFGNIKYVLQYNPSQFSVFYDSLAAAGLIDTLAKPGPFTVFAFTNDLPLYNLPGLAGNYIVRDSVVIHQVLPGQSKLLTSLSGYRIFLDAFRVGADTFYTANGALIRASDQQAHNGLVNVLGRLMLFNYYPDCMYYVRSNPYMSIFAYALQRSHMDAVLADTSKEYTVLMPSNDAMVAAGLSFEAVSQSDPDSLAEHVIKYHILPGRNFLYGYKAQYHGDGINPDTLSVPTLSGQTLGVVTYPGGATDPMYTLPMFIGASGNTSNFSGDVDVPAGRCAIHVIGTVLMP